MKTKTLKILLVVEFVITVFVLYILLSAFREGWGTRCSVSFHRMGNMSWS